MNSKLIAKLKDLPKEPGVYFHKDKSGEIIYVGKAANLRNRVRQYFQKSRVRDPKTDVLVSEITDTDWMVVESELEALFLEAEMIKRYMPKFNILLRDDKSMSYIKITYDSDYPVVSLTRRPLDDGARYFGPYISTLSVRKALKYLRKIFPFAVSRSINQKRASLYYHIGLDPGLEEGLTTLDDYRANLRKLMLVIEGKRNGVIKDLENEMSKLAKDHQYELAARTRNKIFALKKLGQQIIFSDKEFLDISKDHALTELVGLLSLDKYPRRIEGYDISHMQGSDVVASMVVFTNGVSDKGQYRKFKTKINKNDDFYNMNETISRRLSANNIKKWGRPDLMLIDGGKGQLGAAIKARNDANLANIPMIGLAKREEQIVVSVDQSAVTVNTQLLRKLSGFLEESEDYYLISISHNANIVKLLQRVRDESHRFAVSYHSVLKAKRQTQSILDEIPGVGPATRKALLKKFGSVKGVASASRDEMIDLVGPKKAQTISEYLSV